MKILKNRKTAIFITVVAAIFVTLFGVHRSLNAEAARIESMFYSGVYLTDEKYTEPGIDSHLKRRDKSAAWLATLAENYSGLENMTSELLRALDMLRHANRISEKGEANKLLQTAFDSLYGAFLAASPDERDLALAEQYAATFEGAGAAIDGSRYNHEAYRFTKELGFPAAILKPFVFARDPEMF